MKYLIGVLAVVFLLGLTVGSFAQSVPLPIAVKVVAPNPEGIPVIIENVNSGAKVTVTTNSGGEVIFDWNNVNDRPRSGDQFKVIVNEKSLIATYKNEIVDIFWFDYITPCFGLGTSSCPLPKLPESSPVPAVTTIVEVPVEVEPTPTTCPVGEDLDQTILFVLTFIVGLVVAGGAGVGIKIYTDINGNAKVLHKHYSIRGYHDPNIIHRNEPHKKGELAPKYKKDSNGVWRYQQK